MWAETATAANSKNQVVAAIQNAAAATGADFNYLLQTAQRESGLKPSAESSSSSATGLFQFVDQTWLGLVKQHGAQFGLGSYANQISQDSAGRYQVANAADRQAILALRKNPQVASLMEGEYAQDTKSALESTLGRSVCGGELYAAHFLGADAACKLIAMNQSQPSASAANAFPAAADANRSVFYHADGTPKTVGEVYDWATKPSSGGASMDDSAATAELNLRASITGAPDASQDIAQALGVATLASRAPLSAENTLLQSLAGNGGSSSNPIGTTSGMPLVAMPHAPFVMTPGVVEVLAHMTPLSPPDKDHDGKPDAG